MSLFIFWCLQCIPRMRFVVIFLSEGRFYPFLVCLVVCAVDPWLLEMHGLFVLVEASCHRWLALNFLDYAQEATWGVDMRPYPHRVFSIHQNRFWIFFQISRFNFVLFVLFVCLLRFQVVLSFKTTHWFTLAEGAHSRTATSQDRNCGENEHRDYEDDHDFMGHLHVASWRFVLESWPWNRFCHHQIVLRSHG